MQLQDFAYNLPNERIAQYPLSKRDQAKLLVLNRSTQTILHDQFSNIGKYPAVGVITWPNSD